jgi:hypothetical protein
MPATHEQIAIGASEKRVSVGRPAVDHLDHRHHHPGDHPSDRAHEQDPLAG